MSDGVDEYDGRSFMHPSELRHQRRNDMTTPLTDEALRMVQAAASDLPAPDTCRCGHPVSEHPDCGCDTPCETYSPAHAQMSTRDTLLAYGEWLESQGLMSDPGDDARTHDGLAREFIATWQGLPLAGPVTDAQASPPPLGCYDCGLLYDSPGWVDCFIPNEDWARITPTGDEGGLLCISCTIARLVKAGVTNISMKVASGRRASS